MSPRMPYHCVSSEKGASVMMRWPCAPRNANASQTSIANPANRTERVTNFQRFDFNSGTERDGEMEQNAAMAERYINTHHQLPDQPSTVLSGVSWTIRM